MRGFSRRLEFGAQHVELERKAAKVWQLQALDIVVEQRRASLVAAWLIFAGPLPRRSAAFWVALQPLQSRQAFTHVTS